MILIGLSGKMGVGKDVVGDYLVKNYAFIRMAFADKLKEIAMDLWGLTYEECYIDKTERSRFIMQMLGTEVVRSIEKNTWVDYLMRKIKETEKNFGNPGVVITDVRFPNEADAVREEGGHVWRIEREDTKSTGGEEHPSEVSLDDYKNFQFVFPNNLSIKTLHSKIDRAMFMLNN